ncbi:MAG TPA: DNA repair protein RecO [Vicinamibacterales bacterium]|nr:DNA repair protein RecO [Vicinamibacterales bacterium]
MPLYTADALILRTYRLGEADRIVVFLTSDRGKRRGVAKNAGRSRRRFGGALEPLTHGQVSYFERERRDLVTLHYVEPRRSPLASRQPDAPGYASYFAELIDAWAAEADPDERLFRLGASAVDAMVAGVPIEPLARYFEHWLLRLQGVYPAHGLCRACGRSLEEGGLAARLVEHAFVCERCLPASGPRAGPMLSSGALAFLRLARTAPPAAVGGLDWPAAVLRELEDVHRTLIVTHLDREPRSIRVLKELRRA